MNELHDKLQLKDSFLTKNLFTAFLITNQVYQYKFLNKNSATHHSYFFLV